MRAKTLQIAWHFKTLPEPVFSVDFHPTEPIVVTGGADNAIRMWALHVDWKLTPSVDFLRTLEWHQKSVNVVRFSPCGEFIASASDDGNILLWRREEEGKDISKCDWSVFGALRGHVGDVYDISWAPSGAGSFILSGSVDNTVIVWDTTTGTLIQKIEDASHYVQGVSWDPLGQFFASLSCDRTCRVYSRAKAFHRSMEKRGGKVNRRSKNAFCMKVSLKRVKIASDGSSKHMFRDETVPTFFRRLCWSPEGSLLVVPTGQYLDGEDLKNTCFVFGRNDLSSPMLYLEGFHKATVVAKFSPVLYRHWPNSEEQKAVDLPYRMLFAVASVDDVLIYDTSCLHPIGLASNIHFAAITDLSWSSDGCVLCVSSRDGYCSFITFNENEFGERWKEGETDEHVDSLRQAWRSLLMTPKPRKKQQRVRENPPEPEPEEPVQPEKGTILGYFGKEDHSRAKKKQRQQRNREKPREPEEPVKPQKGMLDFFRKEDRTGGKEEKTDNSPEKKMPEGGAPKRRRIQPTMISNTLNVKNADNVVIDINVGGSEDGVVTGKQADE